MMDRCGDRQRKCEGLEKWPLHLFIESLPVMLQISLLLLACGLCRHMWSVNTSVAYVLTVLTAFGSSFYLGIVFAGASSYECPFQTPVSATLRDIWKATGDQRSTLILRSRSILSRMKQAMKRWVRHRLSVPSPQLDSRVDGAMARWRPPTRGPQTDLALSQTHASDIRCVSWILKNITDREAIDAAIRLAGTIRWFKGGINAEPPYDMIVSTFKSCFDSSNKLYPGSIDQAYYSARAVLQIHVFTIPKVASEFPLPHIDINVGGLSGDLLAVLWLYQDICFGSSLSRKVLSPTFGPAHLKWASNLLLWRTWVHQHTWGTFVFNVDSIESESASWDELPPAVVLDRLLVWCIHLGRHIDKSVLLMEDKSCVTFHFFPLKMHLSSFLVFTRTIFYLNYPAQS